MAGDLDRADQDSGGAAGRAGIPAGRAALLRGPGVHLQAGEDFIVFRYIIYAFR